MDSAAPAPRSIINPPQILPDATVLLFVGGPGGEVVTVSGQPVFYKAENMEKRVLSLKHLGHPLVHKTWLKPHVDSSRGDRGGWGAAV